MYTLLQLNEMSESELRELAKSFGIKKADSESVETLAYAIIENIDICIKISDTPFK